MITDDEGAVRVTIDTAGAAFKIDSETLNEDVQTRKKPTRLLISLSG